MFLRNTYNYVVGYIEIEIQGYFVERFINLCMNRNIEIWDIKRKDNGIINLKFKNSDLDSIYEIEEITRSKVTILHEEGIPKITRLYSKRKLFIIVCVVILVATYLYGLRIWQIDIIGYKNITLEEIEQELLLENVKVGMLKSKLDFDVIKRNIYLRRDDILWIGFDIQGTKATVEVLERTKPEEDELKDVPCDIISDKDGVILKISVRNGSRLVNVGDVVFKGDKLVSGIVSSEHSNDRYVHSDANITLKTWYYGKQSIPFDKTIINKTGNTQNKYELKLGNNIINLSNSGTNFEKYDKITDVKRLTLFGKIETPLELITTTYEEYETDEIKYTEEQALEEAKREATALAKESIPENVEIRNYEYKEFFTEDEVIVKVTIECIENVGLKKAIDF